MLLAQISDIHAAPDEAFLPRLQGALRHVETLAPDAVVVTGDLADGAWAEGYRIIREALDALGIPYWVLPGNADDVGVMRDAFRLSPGVPFHFDAVVGDVRLIGADVTVSGQTYGDVAPHLGWLGATLEDRSEPSLLFMHQPPIVSGIAPMDAVMCRGGAALSAVLDHVAQPPLALACGHVHRPVIGRLGSVPVFICGSICPANPLVLDDGPEPPSSAAASMMVHRVVNGQHVGHVVMLGASQGRT